MANRKRERNKKQVACPHCLSPFCNGHTTADFKCDCGGENSELGHHPLCNKINKKMQFVLQESHG